MSIGMSIKKKEGGTMDQATKNMIKRIEASNEAILGIVSALRNDFNTFVESSKKPVRKPRNESESKWTKEAKEVIDFINQHCGKSFKPNKSNLEHITARLNEGYSVEELRKVVEHRSSLEWYQENRKYMKPSTFFQAKKFDEFLVEANEAFDDTMTGAVLCNEFF